MTTEENQEIQKAGVNARAAGRSRYDNPYLKTEATPSATGESANVWQDKCVAWMFGWDMEDTMRS